MREAVGNEIILLLSHGGIRIEQKRGKFDGWLIMKNGEWLKDRDYFGWLLDASQRYGVDKVYNDFIRVYDVVPNERNNRSSSQISNISMAVIYEVASTYRECSELACIIFTELYTTMVAEEMKAGSKLGRRIKRLAVYQLLCLDMRLNVVVSYSKNRPWRELDEICRGYGF